jgi:hypothetical protein
MIKTTNEFIIKIYKVLLMSVCMFIKKIIWYYNLSYFFKWIDMTKENMTLNIFIFCCINIWYSWNKNLLFKFYRDKFKGKKKSYFNKFLFDIMF